MGSVDIVDKLKTKVLNLLPIEGLEEKVLIKGASSSFIIKVIGAGLAFGVNILLARLLGVNDYGAYVYILSWLLVLSIPVRMGFDNSLLRFIPQYKNAEHWSDLKGIFSFAYKSVFTASVITSGLVVAVIFIFDDLVNGYSKELIVTAAIILPFWNLLSISKNSLKGLKKL